MFHHTKHYFGIGETCVELQYQRIRGFFKCYVLYKSTFYLLTYLLTVWCKFLFV